MKRTFCLRVCLLLLSTVASSWAEGDGIGGMPLFMKPSAFGSQKSYSFSALRDTMMDHGILSFHIANKEWIPHGVLCAAGNETDCAVVDNAQQNRFILLTMGLSTPVNTPGLDYPCYLVDAERVVKPDSVTWGRDSCETFQWFKPVSGENHFIMTINSRYQYEHFAMPEHGHPEFSISQKMITSDLKSWLPSLQNLSALIVSFKARIIREEIDGCRSNDEDCDSKGTIHFRISTPIQFLNKSDDFRDENHGNRLSVGANLYDIRSAHVDTRRCSLRHIDPHMRNAAIRIPNRYCQNPDVFSSRIDNFPSIEFGPDAEKPWASVSYDMVPVIKAAIRNELLISRHMAPFDKKNRRGEYAYEPYFTADKGRSGSQFFSMVEQDDFRHFFVSYFNMGFEASRKGIVSIEIKDFKLMAHVRE